jgi:hypothetical protein
MTQNFFNNLPLICFCLVDKLDNDIHNGSTVMNFAIYLRLRICADCDFMAFIEATNSDANINLLTVVNIDSISICKRQGQGLLHLCACSFFLFFFPEEKTKENMKPFLFLHPP